MGYCKAHLFDFEKHGPIGGRVSSLMGFVGQFSKCRTFDTAQHVVLFFIRKSSQNNKIGIALMNRKLVVSKFHEYSSMF